MRFQFLILSTIVFATSCNTTPGADNKTVSDSPKLSVDTTGLAEFQSMKAQNELGIQNDEEPQEKKSSSQTVKKTTSQSSSSATHSTGSANSTSSTGTSSQTAKKKGWSKTAKGAVIGGVVGAGTGAAVNKKNRAAGAVIGGVVGAGTGAVIGNQMDKKDGRH